MVEAIRPEVRSEIGALETVMIHSPGPEVQNMTPQNAERALYSDILNLSVVTSEYAQFRAVLQRFSRTLEVSELLGELLIDEEARRRLVEDICQNEEIDSLSEQLLSLPPTELTRQLLEGVPLVKDNLTRFLSDERYSLQPLHNCFFTRDASVVFRDRVIVALLASRVRERERIIMRNIFERHPRFEASVVAPPRDLARDKRITLEGGDILVAREDVLLAGNGARTSTQGIDYLLDHLKSRRERTHLLVQELPRQPESFIHLDMVFTFLDVDACLVYEPVILNRHDLRTVRIIVDNGKVDSIIEEETLLSALDRLGFQLEPISCGGDTDDWTQEREQWHSGANFLALAPGRVMGYRRNHFTLAALDRKGFAILEAPDVIEGRVAPKDYRRFAIAVEGSELARGGGGCRCMTMPVRRAPVTW